MAACPLELVAQVLEHCPTSTLVAAAVACADLQLEAERMLYYSVTLRSSDSVQTFCRALSPVDPGGHHSHRRRAAAVRRLHIRTTLKGAQFDLNNSTLNRPDAELAGLVRGVLPGLQNLVAFECNWRGPAHGILAALPRGLTRLAFTFDLDAAAVAALRPLAALRALAVDTGLTVELGPPQSAVHQCAALAGDPACLPALEDLSAPHCCAVALLPGRAIQHVDVVTLLAPFHVADLLAVASPSLTTLIATLLFGGRLVLDMVAQAPTLEALELLDIGVQPDQIATDATVENALRSLPRLRLFRLLTATGENFQPDAMEDSTLTEMVLRWTRSASPALQHIRLGRVDITQAARHGGAVRWTAEWLKKDGTWLRSSNPGSPKLLWAWK